MYAIRSYYAAPGAAKGERRPDDGRKAGVFDDGPGLGEAVGMPAGRNLDADAGHRLLEQVPVFRFLDGGHIGADEFHPVFV